jgi:hypothetical protein
MLSDEQIRVLGSEGRAALIDLAAGPPGFACFVEFDGDGELKRRYWFEPCAMPRCYGESTHNCRMCNDRICLTGCSVREGECYYCVNELTKPWEKDS